MNAIAKRSAPGLPVVPTIPRPSVALESAMNWAENGFKSGPTYRPDDWFSERLPLPAVADEAKALLAIFDQALTPAAPDLVKRWLLPIAAAVANSPTERDFAARAAAIALACVDMPIVAFTARAQREALQTFKFWPSAAEVCALLEEEAAPHRRHRLDVLKIVSVRPIAELEEARRLHDERRRRDGTRRWPSDSRRLISQMTGGL
jgi:hypothetical protein